MKFLKYSKRLRNPNVRGFAESALVASAAVPDSGFTFINNSQGASAAIVELSQCLDTALDEIELDGEPSEQLKFELARLDKAASNYPNSSLSETFTHSPWTCSSFDAQIISVAWKCAAAAYEEEMVPEMDNIKFEVLKKVKPSRTGSVKAAVVTLVEHSPLSSAENPHLPVLVVAVRGSKSTVDFIVNANGESEDTRDLFNVNDLLPQPGSTHSLRAHAGFLNSATELVKYINSSVVNSNARHVLFTGHSAGGAVASLLFLKYLSTARKAGSHQTFSCITFGGAPVIQPNMNQILLRDRQNDANLGLVLAIANEYDLISRADRPYIRSLVNLYRSIFQQPSVTDDESVEDESNSEQNRSQEADPAWGLPEPVFWLVGDIILLRIEVVEMPTGAEKDQQLGGNKRILRAFKMDPEEFAKLLFCRVSVHRRNEYRKRVDMIESGQITG